MEAPEKIYGWMDSHLSIALHYDGCIYKGYCYVIDRKDPQTPLVRLDVMINIEKNRQSEAKEKRAEAKKAENPMETGDLWNDL